LREKKKLDISQKLGTMCFLSKYNHEVKIMKKVIAIVLLVASFSANAYGPYDQAYTINQQYGSSNWYSSPLGMGVAQAGVTLIGGLVNAMNRPEQPQVQQQPQVIYVNGNGQQQGGYQQGGQQQYQQAQPQGGSQTPYYGYGKNPQAAKSNCSYQTLYDQSGNPRYVNVCQ